MIINPKKSSENNMYNQILLPMDGSKNSKRAAKHAIKLAKVHNSNIIVLFVVEPYNPNISVLPISTLPNPDENFYEELRIEGKELIEEFKNYLKEMQKECECENISISYLIKEGKAYNEILKLINEEGIDLTIMGASGRHSALDRLVLGSVTEKVIRESKSPVTVVP